MSELTAKQQMFCKEYIIDLNGTQAAIRAGYSQKTARQIATEMLSKPYIQEHVNSLMDNRSKKVEITADNVLQDILDTREEARIDGKLNERIKCNELLGKHLKLFTDKVDLNANVNVSFLDLIDETDR